MVEAQTANNHEILTVNGLTKIFPREVSWSERIRHFWRRTAPNPIQALTDVSFSLRNRETLGILGESGSGKSTLARILMGLHQPDSGSGTLAGEPLFIADSNALRRQKALMQMIFQDPFSSLDPRMSIRRILTEPLTIHAVAKDPPWEERLQQALAEVGLEPSALARYPNEFSGGQRQRIGICRALLLNPIVLIADEAVSALDVSIQAQILEVLQQLRSSRGLSMLFISHDVAVVRCIADRILVLLRGRVVEEFPTACLLEDVYHPYSKRLVDAALSLREHGTLPDWSETETPKPDGQHGHDGQHGQHGHDGQGRQDGPDGQEISTDTCGFYRQCPEASHQCLTAPPMRELHPGHRVACWSRR